MRPNVFWSLEAPDMHVMQIHAYKENPCTHKIKWVNLKTIKCFSTAGSQCETPFLLICDCNRHMTLCYKSYWLPNTLRTYSLWLVIFLLTTLIKIWPTGYVAEGKATSKTNETHENLSLLMEKQAFNRFAGWRQDCFPNVHRIKGVN